MRNRHKPSFCHNKLKLTKSIVFVDNNVNHWKNDMDKFSTEIDFVCVKSNTKNSHSKKELKYAKSQTRKNNYAKSIASDNLLSYPPNNGIDKQIATKLKMWAKTPGEKYILLDWDRTISCIEGIYPAALNSDVLDDKMLNDIFLYLIREDRIPILKDLFRNLIKSNVKIHILTNNSAASKNSRYRYIFVEILDKLFNDNKSSISREDIDSLLHATVDYTEEGERLLKSNIVCKILPFMQQHC